MQAAVCDEASGGHGPLEDWGKLAGEVPAAGAIVDRFRHHADVIAITGRSYRLKDQATGQKA
jgi:DNA replication protein DnaC